MKLSEMTTNKVKSVQRNLNRHGYMLVVDGVVGRKTSSSIKAFKVSKGLYNTTYVGPKTLKFLSEPAVKLDTRSYKGKPKHLQVAYSYLNLREYPGKRHNSTILQWWKDLGLPFRDDETPWCAGYVGGVLEEVGIKSTRSAAARSYNWTAWGKVHREPAVGDVVTFWRGSRRGPYGHVGFVVGKDRKGNLMVLGGNQGNRVSIRPFSRARILSFHQVPGTNVPRGWATLPTLKSNGKLSTNEA